MKENLKITLYAGMFKKNMDGATKTLYELMDSLLSQGHFMQIFAFAITPIQRDNLSLNKLWAIPFIFYPAYKMSLPFPRLIQQLRQFKPDIIHIAAPDLVGVFLIRYAQKNRIPLVMSYHTDFPSYLEDFKISFLKKTMWKFFRWFYNQAAMVFVPSHGVLTELKTHGITNLKIWSRGIHPHLFNPQLRSETLRSAWGSPLKKIIVYSGRFVWYKGLRVFIDVYQLFQQRRPNQAAFVLLGSGPEENVLRKAMPKAIFPGYLHGEALGQAYASADIFFFPSVTETFGNVVQEAVSCGLPAVVSDVGGCQEIVRNSQAGLIAKARDTEDYFNCLTRLIDDPLLYRTLRENGLNYFKHRSWNEINQIVIDQYHHTVAAAQKKG